MIEKTNYRQSYLDKKRILSELPENPSANDVLDHLLGDKDNWNMSEYTLHRYEEDSKRIFLNRLNLIWFYPVYIITIPFQYLFRGKVGVNSNGKIGRLINWLVRLK